MQYSHLRLLGVLVAFCALATAHGHSLTKHVCSAGFSDSRNPALSLHGSFGQPIVGLSYGSPASASLGFWNSNTAKTTSIVSQPAFAAIVTNSPNPFYISTTVRFNLKTAANVELRVFGENGALVRSQVLKQCSQGINEFMFERDNLPSGQYRYSLFDGISSQNGSLTILR